MTNRPPVNLKGAKLFVATPMYGGMCHAVFTTSLTGLVALCARHEVSLRFHVTTDESLIPKARNAGVHEFLRSDADYFMFIDSDIGFNPADVLGMLALMLSDTNRKYDVLAVPYPKKSINWSKIKEALDAKISHPNPEDMAKSGYLFSFNPTKGEEFTFSPFQVSEVNDVGTGFMMIPRSTFTRYKNFYPDNSYLPHPEKLGVPTDPSSAMHSFFNPKIDPETKYYIGEDYMFCKDVKKMGGKIWILPWIELTHAGSYHYTSSLSKAASLMRPLS